jgi:two-component system, cell cycle response regulator
MARNEIPDIVLLDVYMPGLNGYEVCKLLKADPATLHTKVIIISAMIQDFDQLKSQEAGADGFIGKPFSSTTLIEKVEALLGSG